MNKVLRVVLVLSGFLIVAGAHAQNYPSKPIRLINPYQVGGGVDLLARLIGEQMQAKWGQPVVVESKAGAGGNVGADFVAKSAPDGQTLLITASTVTINPYFFAQMPFDVQKDLAPISMVASQEFYLIVANSLPVKNMAELIAYAKANPKKLFYSTPGIGTPQHLGGELLKTMAGIDIVHAPYKGQTPAVQDVVAGRVHMTLATLNQAMPLVKEGQVRGIAIAAKQRVSNHKDVPVVAETLPGYEINTWFALFAPARTPAPIVQQLAEEVKRISQLPEFKERLIPLGYEIASSTPQELRAAIAADLAKWGGVAKAAGIKPE